ncbi:MAG: Electron transport complex protein rnfB [bacterium ADurb.Bin478]|nr:MAG: Electron transport complex protein rnfB [bacterium ADurb.Bin478]
MNPVFISTAVMGGLGLFCAGVLYFAARVFYTQEDPRVDLVMALLANSNCGACGYPGCRAYADALISGQVKSKCPVTSSENMAQISRLLGASLVELESMVAVIHCQGDSSAAKFVGTYYGINDCRAAQLIGGVEKMCPYGCIGLGTCITVCPSAAIVKKGRIVEVIRSRCIGCGKCVDVCPRKIISLVPASKDVVIACRSHDRAPLVKEYCRVGCIVCKKCIKTCPYGAISEDDNLVKIDYNVCTSCGECVAVCPQNTIRALIPDRDRSAFKMKTAQAVEVEK